MKTNIFLIGFLVNSIFQITFSQTSIPEQNLFDYFGQIPPKDSAIVFAPGIVSDTSIKASILAVSPKGDEVLFSAGIWPYTKILNMKKTGNKWSLPDTAIFSKDCWATEPAFSPDNRYLYFSTSKGKSDIKYYSLWRIKKTVDSWSQPESLFDVGADSIWEFHPTVTVDGSVYFCYWDSKNQTGDIYVSQYAANKYSVPVKIDSPISTSYSDVDPFVSPDGAYMIFASDRPDGYGDHDQYISFRNNNGTWTSVKNLGSKFNTKGGDYDMDISPDGKYIFTYLNNLIYWMPIGNLLR
jgi:Tol biopolymer transport system component